MVYSSTIVIEDSDNCTSRVIVRITKSTTGFSNQLRTINSVKQLEESFHFATWGQGLNNRSQTTSTHSIVEVPHLSLWNQTLLNIENKQENRHFIQILGLVQLEFVAWKGIPHPKPELQQKGESSIANRVDKPTPGRSTGFNSVQLTLLERPIS